MYFDGLFAGDFGGGDILGKVDEASTGLFGLCDFECLAHDFGDDLRLADLRGVFGDGLEHIHQIEYLMTLFVHARGGALSGDGDDRSAVHIGVRDAGDQVRRSGPEGG